MDWDPNPDNDDCELINSFCSSKIQYFPALKDTIFELHLCISNTISCSIAFSWRWENANFSKHGVIFMCCSVLQCVAVCCSVLHCTAVCSTVLQCVAVRCSALQCVAVRCSALQCVAAHRSVLQSSATWRE